MRWLALTLLIVTTSSYAGWKADTKKILKEYKYACSSTQVRVDSIVPNESISGRVMGLPQEALDKFKVVFYVKTNVWYVHPYAYYEGQEEGYSYSNLDSTGAFKIKTIKRDVPSKELAAVLVPKTYKIKDRRWWLNPLLGFLGGILKYDCSYTVIPGNGDF
jgi:hypothetical protein